MKKEKKNKFSCRKVSLLTTLFSAQIQKINLDAVQTEQNFVLLLMLKTYQNSFKLTSGTCLKHSTLLMSVRFRFYLPFQPKNYATVFFFPNKIWQHCIQTYVPNLYYSQETPSWRNHQFFEFPIGISRTKLFGKALRFQGPTSLAWTRRSQSSGYCSIGYVPMTSQCGI